MKPHHTILLALSLLACGPVLAAPGSEDIEAFLRAERSFWTQRIPFASWDDALRAAQAAPISPRQALRRLEQFLAGQTDKPGELYPPYGKSRHLCLVIGDYYFFSGRVAYKLASQGRVKGFFVNMKDGSVIPYTGEAFPYDVPYGYDQTLLLLEIGEAVRPVEAAIARYNQELPPGAPRFDPETHLLDVLTVKTPETQWDSSDTDAYNYYRIYIEGPMRKLGRDYGRYRCIVDRRSGRILSFTRTR